jgi:hypothetical protein
MVGFVGELFTISKMYADEKMKSIVEYLGGRKAFDITVGEKKVLVKTNLYGTIEKQEFGVDKGFLWSDLRVEKPSKEKGKPFKQIDFDFVVLVGIRNKAPRFFVLTRENFIKISSKHCWRGAKGSRAAAFIEEIDPEKYKTLSKAKREYVDYFRRKEIVDVLRESEDKWERIKNSISLARPRAL